MLLESGRASVVRFQLQYSHFFLTYTNISHLIWTISLNIWVLLYKTTVGAFRSNSKVAISLCHALKLADSGLSGAAESQLSPFLVRRPWPKHSIFHFAAFGRGRNSVFAVFYSSAMAENRFSSFSRFRPWPTNVFCLFSFFIRGWRMVFGVFSFSSVDDDWFSSFSLFHPWMMHGFSHFLAFICGWRMVFRVFSLSSVDDEWFFAFSCFHPWMMNSFSRF